MPAVPLPREAADGVRFFPEIATWTAARGPFRGTVTRYDWLYASGVWHAAGGALSMLWHPKVGPLFVSSLAKYVRVEADNMQPSPEALDFPLTPRVEQIVGGERFATFCDLNASVRVADEAGTIRFEVQAALCNTQGKPGGRLVYGLSSAAVEIIAAVTSRDTASDAVSPQLVLPLVSAYADSVERHADHRIAVHKEGATISIAANAPVGVPLAARSRVFNLVPGFLAIPVSIDLPAGREVRCEIRVTG